MAPEGSALAAPAVGPVTRRGDQRVGASGGDDQSPGGGDATPKADGALIAYALRARPA